MHRLLVLAVLVLLGLGTAGPLAAQQESEESVPPVMPPQSISTMLRNAGYVLTAEEAAYLDADEQHTERFVTPLLNVELHAPYINDEFSRQIVLHQLRAITTLDPAGTGVAPPASLAELDRVAVARRAALRQAAEQWLAGLEANDPNWVMRGAEAYGTAQQREADWYAALRQHLTGGAAGGAPGLPAQP